MNKKKHRFKEKKKKRKERKNQYKAIEIAVRCRAQIPKYVKILWSYQFPHIIENLYSFM